MITQRYLLLGSVVALTAACSAAHPPGDPDAGIVIPDSARPPDAVFYDAGPPTGNIGGACTAASDCGALPGAECIEDPFLFPGGYCTLPCDPAATDVMCPVGSLCQDFGGGQAFCVLSCDPASTARQCNGRMGYGCSTDFDFSGVCVAGCVDATDCASGLMCNPTGGELGAGGCFTPGAMVGDDCVDDSECSAESLCLPEEGGGWPGGACLTPGCDATANTGCVGDAECILLSGGFGPPTGFCIDGCTTTADCRSGYTCETSGANPDRRYCAPGCTLDSQCASGAVCNQGLGTCGDRFTGAVGGTCSRRDPSTCPGGTCFSERTGGFPGGGYCTLAGCGPDEPCPTGSVCTTRPGASSICMDACATDSDCRASYACRPSDPADGTSATVCVPACTATSCTTMGNVCNVGTGFCGPMFSAASLGTPCTSDTGCVGGRCMTEATFGYPGGECVYAGCSITTGVTGASCPASSACVDDHSGSPDLGICAPTCTVGGTTCRAGYACVALVSGMPEGACQPACAAGSCATPRTCNTTSGLCE